MTSTNNSKLKDSKLTPHQPATVNNIAGAPAFKLHIDSKLIKSNSSALPDELKNLGVCAYDERDFESGVLSQVDKQIAEYELSNGRKTKNSKYDHSQVNDDEISNEAITDNIVKSSQKRKSTENSESHQKKSKTLSFDETSQSNSSNPNDAETLIKKGSLLNSEYFLW
jgi:hypothetical protein